MGPTEKHGHHKRWNQETNEMRSREKGSSKNGTRSITMSMLRKMKIEKEEPQSIQGRQIQKKEELFPPLREKGSKRFESDLAWSESSSLWLLYIQKKAHRDKGSPPTPGSAFLCHHEFISTHALFFFILGQLQTKNTLSTEDMNRGDLSPRQISRYNVKKKG